MAVCCEPAVAVMFPDVFLSDAAQSHRLATSTRDIVVRRNISCTGLHVKTSHVPALQVMQRFQLMHLRPRALHRSRLMDLRPGHCAAPGSCASVQTLHHPRFCTNIPALHRSRLAHQHPNAALSQAHAPAFQALRRLGHKKQKHEPHTQKRGPPRREVRVFAVDASDG